MQEIFIPNNITYDSAVKFSKSLGSININSIKEKDIIVDARNFMRNNGRIEPFAALFILNSLKAFETRAKENNINLKIKFTKEQNINNIYAKHLRFYSSLNIPYGQKPDEDYLGSSTSSFIPIMKMDVSEVNKSTDEYREIKSIAKQIATVTYRGNEELFECIYYSVTEIIRNVLEHSGSKTLWYSAQYWPSRYGGQIVEIGIMDEGIGIHESLNKELKDEKDVLKFSLIPGCSSKPTTHYIGENADNSGFGLYMISEIGKRHGDFIISSNHESLLINEDTEEITTCLVSGTLLRLRLDINSIKNFNLQRKKLVKEGLEKTDTYLKYIERKKYAPGLATPSFFN